MTAVMEKIAQMITDLQKRVERLEHLEKLYTPAWDDYVVQISQTRLPASAAPNVVSYLSSEVLSFSKSATNTVTFNVQIPHAYKAGSNVEFHIHVVYPNAGTGNSRWQCTYTWANTGGTFAAATTSTAVTKASPNEAAHHQLIELVATIDGTGKTISSILLCSVSRLGGDGADNYDDVIYLVGVDFHIQKDALGSRQETVK